jgi:4-carboxymuconolactone decarboxylase
MSDETNKYDIGMTVRRQVLGDEHVDRARDATSAVDRDFQTWITENVWGDLWARPGLERRERSLVTIAMLAAAGQDELEIHLRAARNTGATPEEIAEVLLHVAVYAGVPAANHAFGIMKDVYGEELA